jgi:hypothetical protein
MKAKNRQKYYLQLHVHTRTPVSKFNCNFVLFNSEHKTSVLQMGSQNSKRKKWLTMKKYLDETILEPTICIIHLFQ